MFSVVDPVSFQAAALAWLGVVSVLLSVALGILIKLWPQIQKLRDLATAHEQGIAQNRSAIQEIEATVKPDAVSPVESEGGP